MPTGTPQPGNPDKPESRAPTGRKGTRRAEKTRKRLTAIKNSVPKLRLSATTRVISAPDGLTTESRGAKILLCAGEAARPGKPDFVRIKIFGIKTRTDEQKYIYEIGHESS
jgi:hypothetical protein